MAGSSARVEWRDRTRKTPPFCALTLQNWLFKPAPRPMQGKGERKLESNAPTSHLCRSIRRQEPARAGQGRPLGRLGLDQSALGFRVLLFTYSYSVPFCGRLGGFAVQIPSGGARSRERGCARTRGRKRGSWARGIVSLGAKSRQLNGGRGEES